MGGGAKTDTDHSPRWLPAGGPAAGLCRPLARASVRRAAAASSRLRTSIPGDGAGVFNTGLEFSMRQGSVGLLTRIGGFSVEKGPWILTNSQILRGF